MSAVLSSLTVEEGFEPTGCAGWTAVDLRFHLLPDARRALLALNTPTAAPADTRAVDHWTAWRPPEPGDEVELWSRRIAAGVHGGVRGVATRYAETPAAVVVAARPLPPDRDDATAARRGTGREPLTADDRAALGDRARVFPLSG